MAVCYLQFQTKHRWSGFLSRPSLSLWDVISLCCSSNGISGLNRPSCLSLWGYQDCRGVSSFLKDRCFVCLFVFLNTKEGKIWPVSVTKKLVGTDTYTIYIFLQGKKNTQIRLDLKHGLNMHLPHTHTHNDRQIHNLEKFAHLCQFIKRPGKRKWKTQSILVNGYKSDMHILVAMTKDLTKAA